MNVGYLVSSKAGHDKGKIYIITAENEEYVWIADGKSKTIEYPKKKKKKHVQIIKVYKDNDVITSLEQKKTVRDEEIRRVIETYKKKQCSE